MRPISAGETPFSLEPTLEQVLGQIPGGGGPFRLRLPAPTGCAVCTECISTSFSRNSICSYYTTSTLIQGGTGR